MSEILAFLGALPELIALFKNFIAWVKKISGNDPKAFFQQMNQAFATLNQAQTPEERSHAAKAISDLIARLP